MSKKAKKETKKQKDVKKEDVKKEEKVIDMSDPRTMSKKEINEALQDKDSLNAKQAFKLKMRTLKYPATNADMKAALTELGKKMSTQVAYLAHTKRKENPFTFRLNKKGAKYMFEDKEPDQYPPKK